MDPVSNQCEHFCKQECIPVGCVPSAGVAVSPVTHALLPHMPSHHACPPAMHAPYHAHPPPCMPPFATHTPFAMHAPLCHSHPPVYRMADACENITFPQLLSQTVNVLEPIDPIPSLFLVPVSILVQCEYTMTPVRPDGRERLPI